MFAKSGEGSLCGRMGQSMRLILAEAHYPAFQFAYINRASNRAADVGCHEPPRGVRMPRSFNSTATARTLVIPWDRRSSAMAICVRLDRSHGLHVCRPDLPLR